jgi:hypothetical protein
MVVTMGDDSDSAYRSLRLTHKVSDSVYLLVKALGNAYWMLAAAVLAALCWSLRKAPTAPALFPLAPLAALAAAATLYLMSVHGIAEGAGRHHMAWSWIYALVLTAGLARIRSVSDQA